MATRIRTLRRSGRVLAVVGMDHLDAIATRIEGDARPFTE
jgi:pheromone shutdown protein TraB